MSVDGFELHMNNWLRKRHAEDRARLAQKNAEILVTELIWRLGCTVRYDVTKRHILVNPDSERLLTITLENAREMPTETLVGWVKERLS